MGIMDGIGGDVEVGSTGRFLKGADFDGEGQKLTVVGVEIFTPENADYGVKHTYGAGGAVVKENWFVKNGILNEGQSFKYKFTDEDMPKEFDNSSLSFYFKFKDANPEEGQVVMIKRNKKSNTDVEWTITK